MIFIYDFVIRENHWQIASLVTKKSLFTVTHALFYMSETLTNALSFGVFINWESITKMTWKKLFFLLFFLLLVLGSTKNNFCMSWSVSFPKTQRVKAKHNYTKPLMCDVLCTDCILSDESVCLKLLTWLINPGMEQFLNCCSQTIWYGIHVM